MINFLECPAELQKLQPVFLIAKDVINIIKIGVPILLIVWGMIDFGKSVIGKDDAEIKKSQGAFVKRLISAVAVFLIITIISLVLKLIDKYLPNENAMGWYDCLQLDSGNSTVQGNNSNNDNNSNNNSNNAKTECSDYETMQEKNSCWECEGKWDFSTNTCKGASKCSDYSSSYMKDKCSNCSESFGTWDYNSDSCLCASPYMLDQDGLCEKITKCSDYSSSGMRDRCSNCSESFGTWDYKSSSCLCNSPYKLDKDGLCEK